MTETKADPVTAPSEEAAAADAIPVPADLAELSARLAAEVERLDLELAEVDLLISQATVEADRHEGRRASAAEKLAAAPKDGDRGPILELANQVVTLTRRAALMASQVEVLDGKRRSLVRHRDTMAALATAVAAMDPLAAALRPAAEASSGRPVTDIDGDPAVTRLILSGQEELRRDIARAMHDGPAQSLTNIVLQAQIVERLVGSDPGLAQGEVKQLISMVQQTLDATKTFIFDVRPMVLDDLGLVPTLRRAARERGERTGIPVEFESMGRDQRLTRELESGLFRMIDEALLGYLERSPDRMSIHLDWSPDRLEVHVIASKAVAARPEDPDLTADSGKDLPPALARMVEERRALARDRHEAARIEALVVLSPATWREIQGRAATLGVFTELLAEGADLHLVVDSPSIADG